MGWFGFPVLLFVWVYYNLLAWGWFDAVSSSPPSRYLLMESMAAELALLVRVSAGCWLGSWGYWFLAGAAAPSLSACACWLEFVPALAVLSWWKAWLLELALLVHVSAGCWLGSWGYWFLAGAAAPSLVHVHAGWSFLHLQPIKLLPLLPGPSAGLEIGCLVFWIS